MRNAFLTPNVTELSGRNIRRYFCIDSGLARFLTGALDELNHAYNWEPFGDMSPDQMVELLEEAIASMGNCEMIGQIIATVGTLPDYCLLMDGASVLVTDYPDLATAVPQWVSGSVITLPDMSHAYIVGDLVNTGTFQGDNTHTLTEGEMPIHSHSYTMAVASVSTVVVPDEPSAVPAVGVTDAAGGGLAHNNMPYSLGVKWAIIAK